MMTHVFRGLNARTSVRAACDVTEWQDTQLSLRTFQVIPLSPCAGVTCVCMPQPVCTLRKPMKLARRSSPPKPSGSLSEPSAAGVAEWVEHTTTLAEILFGPVEGAHQKYRPEDWLHHQCRQKMVDALQAGPL